MTQHPPSVYRKLCPNWISNVVMCNFIWHSNFTWRSCFLVHFNFQHMKPQPNYKITHKNTYCKVIKSVYIKELWYRICQHTRIVTTAKYIVLIKFQLYLYLNSFSISGGDSPIFPFWMKNGGFYCKMPNLHLPFIFLFTFQIKEYS